MNPHIHTILEREAPQHTAQTGEELTDRLIEALVPGLELLTVEFGRRLGLYELLGSAGEMTPRDFAAASACSPRMIREWLEQQTTMGVLRVDDPAAEAEERRFSFPDAHRAVLLDPDSPLYALGAATIFAGTASAFEAVLEAARTGSGVSYGDFGAGVRHGLRQLNRPGFVGELDDWMTHLPDVAARLRGGGIILDLGCGIGWSTIALARLFPAAVIIGVDLDAASIEEARQLAVEQNLEERIVFARADATDEAALSALTGGDADLVTVFEALHDMNEPQAALGAARSVLAADGAVLVGDEKVADEFTPDGDFLERLNYGFSVLHCLPATMAEGDGTANGTVLRARTVGAWAAEAGFGATTVLGIEHPFWRFYRIDR